MLSFYRCIRNEGRVCIVYYLCISDIYEMKLKCFYKGLS